MWKQDGLDLRLKPYGCLALGNEFGLIEVVPHAHTTSNINIVSSKYILTAWQVSRSDVSQRIFFSRNLVECEQFTAEKHYRNGSARKIPLKLRGVKQLRPLWLVVPGTLFWLLLWAWLIVITTTLCLPKMAICSVSFSFSWTTNLDPWIFFKIIFSP